MTKALFKKMSLYLVISSIIGFIFEIITKFENYTIALPLAVSLFSLYIFKTNVNKTLRFFIMSCGGVFALSFLATFLFNVYDEKYYGDMVLFGVIIYIPILYLIGMGFGVFMYKIHLSIPDEEVNGTSVENRITKIITFIVFILIMIFVFFEYMLMNFKANKPVKSYPAYKTEEECKHLNELRHVRSSECYGYFASQKNSAAYCMEMDNNSNPTQSEDFISSCITDYSIYEKDVNVCNEIKKDYFKKSKCHKVYTNEKEYTNVCSPISDKSINRMRKECVSEYYLVAPNRKDCQNIEDNYDKNKCLQETTWLSNLVRKYAKIMEFRDL